MLLYILVIVKQECGTPLLNGAGDLMVYCKTWYGTHLNML